MRADHPSPAPGDVRVTTAARVAVHAFDCLVPLFQCPTCRSLHARDCAKRTGKDRPHDTTYCGGPFRVAMQDLAALLDPEAPPSP